MYLISYDISSNRKRRKIVKLLENYGKRVQYSVFECDIDKTKYQELYGKLALLMSGESEADSIRFYSLCRNCMDKIVVLGIKKSNPVNEEIIVI